MLEKKQKNPGGRPREHNREQIAIELIEWAKQPDSINLNKFCCTREPPMVPSQISIWASECKEFLKAYESAKAFIGARREEKLSRNELHTKAYDLNACTYDFFLKEEKRKQAQFESNIDLEKDIKKMEHAAKLAKDSDTGIPKDVVDKFEEFMSALKKSQSERKIDNINNKAQDKS
jgi:hypothetical protein